MKKKYDNLYLPAGLIILSIVLFISSFYMKSLSKSAIGPDFVPKILSVLLFLLAIADLCMEFKKKSCMADSQEKGMSGDAGSNNRKLSFDKKYSFPLTIILIALYVGLMESVGFLLTTIIYLFCQIFVYSHKHDRKNLIIYGVISIVTSFSIYFIFVKMFSLVLPAGILG